jgi:hypothetical protein
MPGRARHDELLKMPILSFHLGFTRKAQALQRSQIITYILFRTVVPSAPE